MAALQDEVCGIIPCWDEVPPFPNPSSPHALPPKSPVIFWNCYSEFSLRARWLQNQIRDEPLEKYVPNRNRFRQLFLWQHQHLEVMQVCQFRVMADTANDMSTLPGSDIEASRASFCYIGVMSDTPRVVQTLLGRPGTWALTRGQAQGFWAGAVFGLVFKSVMILRFMGLCELK